MLRNATNFREVENIIQNAPKVPLGTILPYFHESTLPENYMWCDGSDCSDREIASIGINKTPDLRGRFLRMASDSHDFGSIEEDTIRNIVGSLNIDDYSKSFGPTNNPPGVTLFNGMKNTELGETSAIYYKRNSYQNGEWAVAKRPEGGGGTSDILFDASRVVPTSDEVRPINMVVMYIIYVGKVIAKSIDTDKKNFKAILLKITSFYYN